MVTKRPKILVFNYCYHGTVDEAFITLEVLLFYNDSHYRMEKQSLEEAIWDLQ